MNAIGRPTWILVASGAMGELHNVAAGNIHDENIEISRFESTSPCKCDVLAVRVPRGIHCVALARR